MRTCLVALTATIACALALGACGANGSNGSAGSSGSGPILLMTIGPVDAPGFSLPSIPTGAQVAVDDINSAGGLGGRQLKLITCNDQNDPNKALGCARQAVQQHVTALVGGLTLFDAQIVPVIQKAGIPWIGLTSTSAYTQDNLFLTGSEAATTVTAVGAALARQGCRQVAIVGNGTSVALTDDLYVTAGVKAATGQIVDMAEAPANSADWAPTVADVLAQHPDCIALTTGPTQTGPFLTALAPYRKSIKIAVPSGGLPVPLVKQLGATANGVLVIDTYLPFTSDAPKVQALKAAVLKATPNATLDTFVDTGYVAVEIVAEAAQKLSDISASTLMKTLPGVIDLNTGVGPVIDLARPNPVPRFSRVFNPNAYILVAQNGELVLDQPRPVNVQAAIGMLSGI